ncbi:MULTISPECIES: hypothetical protein [Enterococcus]|uniref:Zinc finger CHC2-type domain-containing protein n=1 Tax=Enterococcus gilvus ATCC BAA-350 TaxID=1158614 RepID=R2XKZ7_9ENTE|nr:MULTISPECIES: hypothetical protein [Enterococcus]EOI55589.1 hypothetical protein UKC_02798 [Enterococcus gilvus ATCC BAA-350]EOW81868.1 hypothetical protein I592_01168 [Enterococcus gilvus ATCC BAA-350]MDB1750003.1 hypothetical protein [Enterococcus avium]MDB1754052.1 hypothetical protein [Enterococcus avium]MDB1761125.1 hypothetical protein [Enterococcus avium]
MKKIPMMVDTERITSKPTPKETEGADGIWGRCLLKDNYREVSKEELLEILGSGTSFIPCKINGFINKKENLLETHLVILDVDNTEPDENGKPIPLSKADPRYLSIDKAIGMPIIRDGAFAVQKSIRYSKESERFRIVFLLKEPITHWKENEKLYKCLQKQIPYCDEAVSLSTRIFYGGKSDKGAVIRIGNVFDNSSLNFDDMVETTEDKKIILPDAMKESTADFVEMIKRGNSGEMKEWFRGTLFDPVNMTIDEIYRQLLQTDMTKLLKTEGNKFCCLFHDDEHPSGAIYKGSDNSNWYYRCYSESCGVKADFLSIIKGILGLNSRVEAFNWFLKKMDLYPEEYRSIIDQITVGFETLKSNDDGLHKTIRGQKLSEMEEIYTILSSNVYFSGDKEGNTISIMSGSMLAQHMERLYGYKIGHNYAVGKWNKLLSFMTFLGMVEKLDDNSLSKSVKDYLKQVAEHTKKIIGGSPQLAKEFEPKRVSVYRLCKLDSSFFERLRDEIIPVLEKFYFTYQHFSYAWVKLCFGEEKAKQVFPQNDRITLSDKKIEILTKASIVLEQLDPLKVYVISEKELIREVAKLLPKYSSSSVQSVLKENRGYFVKQGYYLFRATKDIKKILNLRASRSCMVYSVMSPNIDEPFRELVLEGTLTPMYQVKVYVQNGKKISARREPIKFN